MADLKDDRRDSQATLLHLDPAPIESPVDERGFPSLERDHVDLESNSAYGEGDGMESSTASTLKPGSMTASTTSAPGLSGSGWGGSAIFYLTRVQRYSSYAMSIFTTLHLTNVSLIPATTGSVDASETYLLMTREIYQTALTEPILVFLPVVAHVGSGVALRLIRRAQNIRRYGRATPGFWHRGEKGEDSSSIASSGGGGRAWGTWPPLSWISVSGYAFTLFYSAHVLMNRLLPLSVEGDSSNIGLGYVSHGFAQHPWVSRLAYLGLISLGTGHMVWGAARWAGYAPSTRGWLPPRKAPGRDKIVNTVDKKTRRERRRKWIGVHVVAIAAAALWGVGGMGVVSRGGASGGWVGSLYDGLYAKVGL